MQKELQNRDLDASNYFLREHYIRTRKKQEVIQSRKTMNFLQNLTEAQLKELIDRQPDDTKARSEFQRRSNTVIRLHKDGLLDDLANFSGTVEKIMTKYKSNSTSARQNLGRVFTLVKCTYLHPTDPVPLSSDVNKENIASVMEAFWNWNRQERKKTNHREQGEFSPQEEKAISDIQFKDVMDTVIQKYRKDAEPLFGNPTAESRMIIQRYILLLYMLFEPNVRLTPLVNLKYFGNSLRDNIICLGKNDSVVCIFNRLKRENAPVVHVLSEVTSPEYRRFFEMFRQGKEDEESGYFFTNAENERLTVNWAQKQTNELLRTMFPSSRLTSRLLRILETMHSMEEESPMTHAELEAFSRARAHCIEESLKYNRCKRRRISTDDSV
jgi:hypothetical protein